MAAGHDHGHLVGEIVRRITGTSIGRFFADEIAGPLGADFQIGLPEEDFPRVSNAIFPGYPFPEDPLTEPPDPDSVPAKTFGPAHDRVAQAATAAWRRTEIPSGNGHGWGGAIVVNDLDRRMTFAYVMNKMGLSSPGGLGTERTKDYTRAAFACADR